MKVVDINLLLYAVNTDAPEHARAKRFWERAVVGDETVGLAWLVLLGFLRISANPRVMPNPLPVFRATSIVDEWLRLPGVEVARPGARHWPILQELLAELGVAANLTSDAHLAAIAIEHGGTVYSSDTDFSRFRGLRWVNPLEDEESA